nr:thermonuclease family protein [Lichenifustis flavocetrariae]
MANVDAPETDQPFGKRAGRALHDLTYGKKVEIDYRGEYPYREREREIIGVIHAPYDVAEEMVREGMAWDYVRYDTDPAIPCLEQQARAGHLGLWSQLGAIPPWEWRHAH